MTKGSCECRVNRETENRQERKNRKGHMRARETEWNRERRVWQWRIEAVKDICRAICFYRRRETNSFFLLLQRTKDTHQFKSAEFLCLTFSLSDNGEGVFFPPLVHSSRRGRRHPSRGILGNLAWPETLRRRADGGRALCYLLLT